MKIEKEWRRKREKARHLKQGSEQEPSSPNQNDMIMILITCTWSSGQSKAPESWARTARMSKANGAHEILLNKMDLGGGYLKLSLLRWSFASWSTICMFTFSYSCPPEVWKAREDRLAQLQGFKNDEWLQEWSQRKKIFYFKWSGQTHFFRGRSYWHICAFAIATITIVGAF